MARFGTLMLVLIGGTFTTIFGATLLADAVTHSMGTYAGLVACVGAVVLGFSATTLTMGWLDG